MHPPRQASLPPSPGYKSENTGNTLPNLIIWMSSADIIGPHSFFQNKLLSQSQFPVHLLSSLDTPSTPCFSRNEQPGTWLYFLPAQPPLCGITSPSACSPTTLGPSSFYDPATLTWKCAFSVPTPGQPKRGSGWKTIGSGFSGWSLLPLIRSLLPTMTTLNNPHTLPSLLPYLQPSQMIVSLISLWKLRLNSLNFCSHTYTQGEIQVRGAWHLSRRGS